MEDLRQAGFWQFRIFAYMFGLFGAAALFLASVGVYSVLSISVSRVCLDMLRSKRSRREDSIDDQAVEPRVMRADGTDPDGAAAGRDGD